MKSMFLLFRAVSARRKGPSWAQSSGKRWQWVEWWEVEGCFHFYLQTFAPGSFDVCLGSQPRSMRIMEGMVDDIQIHTLNLWQLQELNLRLPVNCCQHLIICTSFFLYCSSSLALPCNCVKVHRAALGRGANVGEGGHWLSPNVIFPKCFEVNSEMSGPLWANSRKS